MAEYLENTTGKKPEEMTEVEKLNAGLEYNFWDDGVDALKLHAVQGCQKLNAIPVTDYAARRQAVKDLLGSTGENPEILPIFNCDNGKISMWVTTFWLTIMSPFWISLQYISAIM